MIIFNPYPTLYIQIAFFISFEIVEMPRRGGRGEGLNWLVKNLGYL